MGRLFFGNSLSWGSEIEAKLVTLGATCVEHLKECTNKEWANLFVTETTITRRLATRVFAALKKEQGIDPKKCASQLPPPLSSLSRRRSNKDDGTSFKLTEKAITVKYISKEIKKRLWLSSCRDELFISPRILMIRHLRMRGLLEIVIVLALTMVVMT